MSKIGLGIITCNREDFYKKCIESVVPCPLDEIVTVNDGDPYESEPLRGDLIQHETNKGVGVSKNDALKYLVDKGCEHLFLMEDDILIRDPENVGYRVFAEYIKAAHVSGLWHLMFGYHGPANKAPGTQDPVPRLGVQYSDECEISFNNHCVGAFCYYHKGVIKHVGMMDETFVNAWEHVEHSYRIVKEGLLPAYWWWPDISSSCKYLDEQACSEENSSIRPRSDWMENIQKGGKYFYDKHKYYPTTIPDSTVDQVKDKLKFIKNTYSRPIH